MFSSLQPDSASQARLLHVCIQIQKALPVSSAKKQEVTAEPELMNLETAIFKLTRPSESGSLEQCPT
jgi:hypothetical protein